MNLNALWRIFFSLFLLSVSPSDCSTEDVQILKVVCFFTTWSSSRSGVSIFCNAVIMGEVLFWQRTEKRDAAVRLRRPAALSAMSATSWRAGRGSTTGLVVIRSRLWALSSVWQRAAEHKLQTGGRRHGSRLEATPTIPPADDGGWKKAWHNVDNDGQFCDVCLSLCYRDVRSLPLGSVTLK